MIEFNKELCDARHQDLKEQLNMLFSSDREIREDFEELKKSINGKFTKLFILLFTVVGMLSMNLILLLLKGIR